MSRQLSTLCENTTKKHADLGWERKELEKIKEVMPESGMEIGVGGCRVATLKGVGDRKSKQTRRVTGTESTEIVGSEIVKDCICALSQDS